MLNHIIKHFTKKELSNLNNIRLNIFLIPIFLFVLFLLFRHFELIDLNYSIILAIIGMYLGIRTITVGNNFVSNIKIENTKLILSKTYITGNRENIVISISDIEKIKSRERVKRGYGKLWIHCSEKLYEFNTIDSARNSSILNELDVEKI